MNPWMPASMIISRTYLFAHKIFSNHLPDFHDPLLTIQEELCFLS